MCLQFFVCLFLFQLCKVSDEENQIPRANPSKDYWPHKDFGVASGRHGIRIYINFM
jgi:hypothetical protein